MSEPVFIRTAGKMDLEAIQRLLKETWHATYDSIHGKAKVDEICMAWHSIEVLEPKLTQPLTEFIVADTGTKIVGMAYASQLDSMAILHQLYVHPSAQGNGVGQELLQEITFCFDSAEKLALEVDTKNKGAIKFYERNDFKKIGETENCGTQDSGIPAFVYEKTLLA